MVVTLGVPIPDFLPAFATEGANDAYSAVNAWAKEIFEARGSERRRGEILLHGRGQGIIALWSDMPKAAFDSLAELDWGPLPRAWLQHLTFWRRISTCTCTGPLTSNGMPRSTSGSTRTKATDPPPDLARSKWFLLSLIGLVAAALARLRRRRRVD